MIHINSSYAYGRFRLSLLPVSLCNQKIVQVVQQLFQPDWETQRGEEEENKQHVLRTERTKLERQASVYVLH